LVPFLYLGATHTRLRAHDHYTSSTLIGGRGGAGPSSLPTTLEGPTEYVNARWMYTLYGFLHGIKWIMFHGRSVCFQKPPLGDRPNTKLGDYGIWTLTTVDLFYSIMCEDLYEKNIIETKFGWGTGHIWFHTTRLWRCLGIAFGHFLLGSHNFMVTALGSCAKWPLGQICFMKHKFKLQWVLVCHGQNPT
jgi:hypothetical protein